MDLVTKQLQLKVIVARIRLVQVKHSHVYVRHKLIEKKVNKLSILVSDSMYAHDERCDQVDG